MGRTDLPGGDWPMLEAQHAPPAAGAARRETLVLPGHGDATTLAEEREDNPFLTGAMRP